MDLRAGYDLNLANKGGRINQDSELVARHRRAAPGQPACLPPSWHKPHPSPQTHPLLPSPGIILAYHFSPSSRLPSSFLNLCSSAPHLRSRSAVEYFLSPPLFLAAAPCSLLHSRSTHLFFTFCFS
jgi:hypothetical protein